ncbi:hypothetical protein [Microcoleus vaginatus]|uniref:hypothetical protein n=1 Tax=Microcoleus vaginatus TaxID=119532 RepID=UPI0032A7BC2D
MYTLESLQQKNLKELKEIGYQLNVLPEGDRRYARNWVKALVGKQPPLLQLLEVSPAVEVEPIAEAIEVQAQEPIESKFGRIVYPKPASKPIAQTEINGTIPDAGRFGIASDDLHHSRLTTAQLDGNSSSAQAETQRSQDSDRVLEVERDAQRDRGRTLPQQPIELAASPGVENFTEGDRPPGRGDGKRKSTAHQLLELFKSSAHIIPDSPGDEIKPEVSQSAIAPAAENIPGVGSDPNPILTGIFLSDSFLARYSPPQPEIVHFQADEDGQLSLLDFTVETSDEPPDPDDFQTLAEFRQAIAIWDAQHPAEPLEISLDSMCEWAPCPDEWYEPAAESSSTCNFSIPTFDAWCDRANRQTDGDEPPDTWNYARLPGPKPPKFPPRAIGQVRVSQAKSQNSSKSTVAQNHIKISPVPVESNIRTKPPEAIAILFHSIAAGSNSRLGRDPPGGDAM